MFFPKEATICEVSVRDGFQTAPKVISVEEKVMLIEKIIDAGFKCIEVGMLISDENRAMEWKMHNTSDVLKALNQKDDIDFRVLVQTVGAMETAANCGCRRIKINISSSEEHYKAMTGMTVSDGMKGFERMGTIASNNNIKITGSISLPFVSLFDGVIPLKFLNEVIKRYVYIGADEISLSDSEGLANPKLIYNRCVELKTYFPEVKQWILHTHNTRGMALANIIAGLNAGIQKFDSSLAGIGGCTSLKNARGNVSTEDLLFMMNEMGIETGLDFDKVMAAGKIVEKLVYGVGIDSYMQKINRMKKGIVV